LSRGYDVYAITKYVGALPHNDRIFFVKTVQRIPIVSSYMFSRRAASVVNRLRPGVAIVNTYWGETASLYIDRGIKVLSVIHDVGLFRSEVARKEFIKHRLRVYALRRVVERADAIVVPTYAVKKDLEEYLGAEPGKIYVLGFEGVEAPLRREHVENGVLDIVQVGRFAPNKGHMISIEAIEILVRKVDNLRLWLVGGAGTRGERLYLERVKKRAEEANRKLGREVVKVVVDVDDVGEYYRLADICVAPSISDEGYGLAVAECMGYGKPVIASDIFEETGVADNDRAYIVRRGDPQAIAQAVEDIIRDPETASKKAAKALEYVAKHCKWDNMVDKIEDILRRVAGP